jgi:hypothetical protein
LERIMSTIVPDLSSIVAHSKALAAAVKAAFETIYADYNGGITDVNCAAGMGLQGSKLADDTVTGPKLTDDAVTSDKVADDAITTAKIEYAAVTDDKLGANSVTATKIGPEAVQDSHMDYASVKLARMGMVGQKIAWGYKSGYSLATNAFGDIFIIFATDAVGGDPAFSAAPTYAEIGVVYVSGGTLRLTIHIEAVSATQIYAVAMNGAGAIGSFGVYWMAIGTAP